MRVIPVGYGNPKHRILIDQLMHEANTLLVDVRYSKSSAIPGWHSTSLVRKYEDRYVYMGRTLGNKHYKDGKPIEIVDLSGGIIDLMSLLWDGNTVLLLCGCGAMEPTKEHPYGCHRRVICDALVEACSQVEMVTPEQIIAKEQALVRMLEDREALYLSLNDIQPTMAEYWSLPVAQQRQVRQQIGKR